MIQDGIFYGNLLGLLKNGKWTMNAGEAIALVQLMQELERRLKPAVPVLLEEPIKKGNKK